MKVQISQLADALQKVLNEKAEEAAHESGFVQRKRKLTGPVFVQTLAFGWLERPEASLEDLVDPAYVDKPICSPQALDQRFTEQAADFLRRVLSAALEQAVPARSEAIPLLRRFCGVYVEDCTVLNLPATLAAQFPGCGGNAGEGEAAIKVHLRWELTSGVLTGLNFQPGRQPDVTAGQAAGPLPAGSLRLADMGFFDMELLRGYGEQGVHWISRLPPSVKLVDDTGQVKSVLEFLGRQKGDHVDVATRIGAAEKLPCRLVAFRCPPAIAKLRRQRLEKQARKKGVKVSAQRLALCEWTLYVTNLPEEQLRPEELQVLYRARWQIEFLFKTWKSYGGAGESKGTRPDRVLCELYAKLLAIVIRHWLILSRGGPLAGFSMVSAIHTVQRVVGGLAEAMRRGQPLEKVLERIKDKISHIKRQNRRRKRPSTRQLLFQPRLMN